VISNQDKLSKSNKLTTVIGAHFRELATGLFKAFSTVDPRVDSIRSELIVAARGRAAIFSRRERA
jgi:hypothetical protein